MSSSTANRTRAWGPLAVAAPAVFAAATLAFATPARAVVDGANFNESAISKTYYVDLNGSNGPGTSGGSADPFRSLQAAMNAAEADLASGVGVRIHLNAGVYRENLGDYNFNNAGFNLKNTPLVIQGDPNGGTVVSGSNVFSSWTHEGNGVYSTPWTPNLGNNAYPQATHAPDDTVLAHRAEQVFVDGTPLRPVLLEQYEFRNNGTGGNRWTYLGDNQVLNPVDTLQPGQFGVVERNGTQFENKLFVKLDSGANPSSSLVEAGVRDTLLEISGKNQFALKNLTFQHTANHVERRWAGQDKVGAVVFDTTAGNTDSHLRDVVFDNVNVRWNSAEGIFAEDIDGLTVRDSSFDYNGSQGFSLGRSENILWQDNRANFNNWRDGAIGGQLGWYTGGMKWAGVEGVRIEGHEAVGNIGTGLWFDVDVQDVEINDLVSAYNVQGLFLEISQGPFDIDSSIFAMNFGDSGISVLNAEEVSINNSIIINGVDASEGAVDLNAFDRGTSDETGERYRLVDFLLENSLIFSDTNEPQLVGLEVGYTRGSGLEQFTESQNAYTGLNNIFSTNLPGRAFLYRSDSGFSFDRGDLEDWVEYLMQYESSETGSVFVNPELLGLIDAAGLVLLPVPGGYLDGIDTDLPFADLSGLTPEIAAFFEWAEWDAEVVIVPSPSAITLVGIVGLGSLLRRTPGRR